MEKTDSGQDNSEKEGTHTHTHWRNFGNNPINSCFMFLVKVHRANKIIPVALYWIFILGHILADISIPFLLQFDVLILKRKMGNGWSDCNTYYSMDFKRCNNEAQWGADEFHSQPTGATITSQKWPRLQCSQEMSLDTAYLKWEVETVQGRLLYACYCGYASLSWNDGRRNMRQNDFINKWKYRRSYISYKSRLSSHMKNGGQIYPGPLN